MRGRPYCKVSPRLVTGSFGRSVRGEGREALLAQSLGQGYVCNCPHGNAIGLFFLPIGYIMADKGWSEQTTKEALGAIQQRGLIQYNWRTEWCWVIEDFRHEFGPDPDRRPGDLDERGNAKKEDSRIPLIRDLVQEAAGSGLLGAFMAHHQPHYPYLLGWWNAPSDTPSCDDETPRGTGGSRARVRVQEQDQEVDQDQEEETPPLPPEGGDPPVPRQRKLPRKTTAADVARELVIPAELLRAGIDAEAVAERVRTCKALKHIATWQLELDRLAPLVAELGPEVVLETWRDAIASEWQGCTPEMARSKGRRNVGKPVQGKVAVSVDEMKRRSGYGGRP